MAENTQTNKTSSFNKSEGNRTYRGRFDRNNNSNGKSNFVKKGSFFRAKRECYFSKNHIEFIDYKNADFLKRFLGKNGRITSRRITGTKLIYQRKLANAVKRARFMGLLPFAGPIWSQEYYEQQNREYQERKRNMAAQRAEEESKSQNSSESESLDSTDTNVNKESNESKVQTNN